MADDAGVEGAETGPVAAAIDAKLRAAFAPTELQIINQSHLHAGHAGAPRHDDPDRAESHFKVRVVSPAFAGQSRLARQRAVNEALAEELAGPVHMLSIEALAPDQAG